MNVKPEWAIPIMSITLLAGSYIHQVVSLDSQVTALAGAFDRIESRLGPIVNTNVKQDALIQQQIELNAISKELNKTLSDVNRSIRGLNTAIQYLKEDHK